VTRVAFDPFSETQRTNPYPAYAELRRHAPVQRVERSGNFVVARYDDVFHVLRHPELFSSAAMQQMLLAAFAPGTGMPGMGLSGVDAARMLEGMRELPISLPELLGSRSLIAADPPVHGPLRNLVNRGFTPRRIAALEPRVRAIARASLAAVEGKGEFDLVHDYAIPLPVTVIAELLGVEAERHADFKRWSDTLISGVTGAGGLRPETLLAAFRDLNAYMMGVIDARKAQPREDLISTLAHAEVGESALTSVEILMFTVLLLAAGNETTTNLLGNTLLALLAHPGELARVQRDPALIPGLVDEMLRFDPPVQFVLRRATRDVELAGVPIPAGATLMPLIGSANRDEARFPDPDRLDVTRNTQGHLGFGVGNHFCLGASLARLEARVALEELLARFTAFEPTQASVEWVDSFLVRGPRSLPLRFRVV
jgi:cytochrome P450